MDRRTRIAEAAIEVLARHGSRGLTHRAVDAAAGLPAGSASNVFRTRAALLSGAADRLAERDREALAAWTAAVAGLPHPTTPGPAAPATLRASFGAPPPDPHALAEAVAGYAVALSTPPLHVATRARMLLALEERVDLAAQHQGLIAAFAPVLAALGDPEPERTMRALTDYVDGAILHAFATSTRPIVREETVAALLALLPSAVTSGGAAPAAPTPTGSAAADSGAAGRLRPSPAD